jgi:hypothetical protein
MQLAGQAAYPFLCICYTLTGELLCFQPFQGSGTVVVRPLR